MITKKFSGKAFVATSRARESRRADFVLALALCQTDSAGCRCEKRLLRQSNLFAAPSTLT
ncbi:MAG: hypothetical protein B6D41_04645 [Chloroflexi bacterium UTCFX4]|nr:MAG: hypothetical protein B6D41_04645 [Chloroflexi bacterium UTCFX4]